MDPRLSAIALFGLLYLPWALNSVYQVVDPDAYRGSRRRSIGWVRALMFQAIWGGALALTWERGWWTAADVGWVVDGDWPLRGLIAGVVGSILFILVQEALGHFEPEREPAAVLEGLRGWWPRSRAGKLLVTTSMAINGVTEEVIARGLFVHAVHALTGNAVFAVANGLAIHLLLHAYQGRAKMPFQTAFYAFNVALLYSPGGLFAAMYFHVVNNLLFAISARGRLNWVRANRHGVAGDP